VYDVFRASTGVGLRKPCMQGSDYPGSLCTLMSEVSGSKHDVGLLSSALVCHSGNILP